jgi:hypothetical protein
MIASLTQKNANYFAIISRTNKCIYPPQADLPEEKTEATHPHPKVDTASRRVHEATGTLLLQAKKSFFI